jgi:hypothetical protein
MVSEEIGAFKKKPSTLLWGALRASLELARPPHQRLKGVKVLNSLEDFLLRRELWSSLLAQGCLGKCFLCSDLWALRSHWNHCPRMVTAQPRGRPWCCPCEVGFAEQKSVESMGGQEMCDRVRISGRSPREGNA